VGDPEIVACSAPLVFEQLCTAKNKQRAIGNGLNEAVSRTNNR